MYLVGLFNNVLLLRGISHDVLKQRQLLAVSDITHLQGNV